jgi:hypothetical protein
LSGAALLKALFIVLAVIGLVLLVRAWLSSPRRGSG